MVDAKEPWISRTFLFSPHEWDFLGFLSDHWFGGKLRKKWALARLIDEIRIAFCPPPTDIKSKRQLEVRESDWKFVLGLKDLLGFDSTTGVIRSFMYMMNNAPVCMFPDPRDYWEEPQSVEDIDRHTTHWARKVLEYVKKRRGNTKETKNKLQEFWHTCRLPKSRTRLSAVRMRQIRSFQIIDREKNNVE